MKTKPFIITLVGLLGALLLGVWLISAAQTGPVDAFPMYSPIHPIGDPDIRLVKTVSNDNPTVGDLVTYTLTYWNAEAGSQAFNVRLYDFLPAGAGYVSADPLPDLYQNRALRFDRDSIGPDTTPVQVNVVVEVLGGFDALSNHALVGADGVVPVHAYLYTPVTQPAASLDLIKEGPEYVLINRSIVYEITSRNIGDVPVSDVKLVDVLPTDLPLNGAFPAPDTVTLPVLTWLGGSLAPDESQTTLISTTAPALPGTIVNTALLDGRGKLVTQTLFTTQVVTQGAILRVNKTGSAPIVRLGDELVYTIEYGNEGNQTATGVVLTDTFPADIHVIDYSPGSLRLIDDEQGVWDIGTLPPDASGQIVVTVVVEGAGDRWLLNAVDITGDPGSFPDHDELETYVEKQLVYLPVLAKQYPPD